MHFLQMRSCSSTEGYRYAMSYLCCWLNRLTTARLVVYKIQHERFDRGHLPDSIVDNLIVYVLPYSMESPSCGFFFSIILYSMELRNNGVSTMIWSRTFSHTQWSLPLVDFSFLLFHIQWSYGIMESQQWFDRRRSPILNGVYLSWMFIFYYIQQIHSSYSTEFN